MKISVLLLGFGNVGREFCSLLERKGDKIFSEYGCTIQIKGISTQRRGNLYSEEGLHMPSVFRAEEETGRIDCLRSNGLYISPTLEDLLNNGDYHILVDTTFSSLETGEPARTYMEKALSRGKSVVTCNKSPVFLWYHSLSSLARERGAKFLFEGTVMCGTPLFSLFRHGLPATEVLSFEGVLNGTCNYILELMRQGSTLDDALLDAQRRGYAEPDPSVDIDGWDSAYKAMIVAQAIMGAPRLTKDMIEVRGIREVTPEMLNMTRIKGGVVRLLSKIERKQNSFKIEVAPTALPANHPLVTLYGVTNGAVLCTDTMGEICIEGAGAGSRFAAFALLQDVLSIANSMRR
ncbi:MULTISPECIES: homoserine dehydrogenase [Aminobacterium]|jgi:homoserine dehydrogenase|uniref:Homoserine dehydrogenase n=1 Tax=Aminobacterium colombiense (strain DSM 12261 / ALA-1) TaxID=572547 RepID=D5ED00_AMICL|nr:MULTISPECIES: homoserine dehydrogenase [Aminobacterium]MDD2379618.1 homoserine dehydrogenase [Aminobacterium colombiense]ADE56432.1 Homoserine dehydrogenase [Aminobacterium colombiense DSM 12261]MDD3768132.1 homoserine dehydrogenase [Aminobacterium colombiense]MDD4265990.1 homoserine dehydrogenase [Aminobacterium colombiense]MDD4586420.1 homoserine dehydrogenase [Aminobacterium colombiense]